MLTDESRITAPPKKSIALFRRDLDGKIYYKSYDNSITQVPEEDGMYKIQIVDNLLPFKNVQNFTGEQIKTERYTSQEFFFSIIEAKIIANGRKGDAGATGPQGIQGVIGPQGIQGVIGPPGPAVNLTLGGITQFLSADRTWLWTPAKYHIEAGELVTVPEKYQQIIKDTLLNYGTIINYGQLFTIN